MMKYVSPQFEKLNYFLLMCALVAVLIGLFIIWDVSALSLDDIKQWDCCTNYTIVNNTFTNTTFNNNGTSSHNLLLNLTTYDDHSQYVYLAGRAGGQVLTSGNGINDDLIINGTSSPIKTNSIVNIQPDGGFTNIGSNVPDARFMVVNNDSSIVGFKILTDISTGGKTVFRIGYGDTNKGDITIDNTIYRQRTGTGTNYIIAPAAVDKFLFTTSGNFSVGTTSPTAQLHTTGTVRFANYGAGTLNTDANGNLYVSSDEKIKTDIKNYIGSISKLKNVIPITYKFKPEMGLDNQEHTGFSAQNLLLSIPEAVSKKEDSYYIPETITKDITIMKEVKTGTYNYSISDSAILATLVNSVKEQQIIIENQQKQIDDLEIRVSKLEGGKV